MAGRRAEGDGTIVTDDGPIRFSPEQECDRQSRCQFSISHSAELKLRRTGIVSSLPVAKDASRIPTTSRSRRQHGSDRRQPAHKSRAPRVVSKTTLTRPGQTLNLELARNQNDPEHGLRPFRRSGRSYCAGRALRAPGRRRAIGTVRPFCRFAGFACRSCGSARYSHDIERHHPPLPCRRPRRDDRPAGDWLAGSRRCLEKTFDTPPVSKGLRLENGRGAAVGTRFQPAAGSIVCKSPAQGGQ